MAPRAFVPVLVFDGGNGWERSAHDPGRSAEAGAVSEPAAVQARRAIVSRWVDAFNARDLDGMLACLAEDVDFHPLRLTGVGSSYRGHEGVREWFARLRLLGHDHQIVLSETRDVGGGRVFATGSLTLAREAGVAPFSAVERIDRGLIVAAHHYLTDSDMIERLGLIS